jgi:hypothetical protein
LQQRRRDYALLALLGRSRYPELSPALKKGHRIDPSFEEPK